MPTPTGTQEIPVTPLAPIMVHLLYDTPPRIDMAALTAKVEAYCGRTDPQHRPAPGADSAQYFMLDALAHFKEGVLPSQLCLMPVSSGPLHDRIQEALDQTWDWQEAAEASVLCTHAVMATDLMAANIDRQVRLRQYRGFLRALLELSPCRAMLWMNSGVLADPQRFLQQEQEHQAGSPPPLFGSVNVRFFTIQDADGDMIMDTQGLGVLGLPDLQCHYRELHPPDVAALLYSVAGYLFERGDIIEDGETVPGPPNNDPWRCQHEMSLIPPERIVLDLNPGPPYVAGGRSAES